ncbi:MAG: DUF4476 domain-containing protein, partial [Chitinophagaceae bacterium]|nr:DUF4476 domain-containing protein [Chitinophagaceae bacterium]
MKKIFSIIVLAGFITSSAIAQTTTITFDGIPNNRTFQVVLDGTTYNSSNTNYNNGNTPNTNGVNTNQTITVNNLQPGSHNLAVYRVRNNYNNGNNNNGNGNNGGNRNAIYSNTFQVRQGYDMNISIKGGGEVSFSEKRIRNRNNGGYGQRTAMDDAQFNQIVQSINRTYNPTARLTTERNLVNTTGYYFTTSQVRQLLSLIRGESSRLEIAKLAYQKVTDPTSFRQVYDVFSYQSSRNEMNVYIQNNPNNYGAYNQGGNNQNGNTNNNRVAMSDIDYTRLYQSANNHVYPADKTRDVQEAFTTSGYYFSTAQVKSLLRIVASENDRLTLAKLAYLKTTDVANFSSVYELFSSPSTRDDLNAYVMNNGGVNTGYSNTQYNNRVAMDDASFSQLFQKAGNHFLPWDK